MTEPLGELFTALVVDPRPLRLRRMHGAHGIKDGETCGGCKHLVAKQYASRYYKCELSNVTASAATDWRCGWVACGKWEAK